MDPRQDITQNQAVVRMDMLLEAIDRLIISVNTLVERMNNGS